MNTWKKRHPPKNGSPFMGVLYLPKLFGSSYRSYPWMYYIKTISGLRTQITGLSAAKYIFKGKQRGALCLLQCLANCTGPEASKNN
jgi:hypothetical protein